MVLRRGLGLALIAAATLTAEVALTRLLSVGLYHHLAFVVVCTAMFGTAAGGLAVVIVPSARRGDGDRMTGWASLAFAGGLPIAFAVSQQIPLAPLALTTQPAQALWLGLVYLTLALPFAAGGTAVALMLDRHADRAPTLYAADLAGASAGCFIALGALFVGPSGLYVASALALGAGWAFGAPRRAALLVTAGVLAASAIAPWAPLPLHISPNKVTRAGVPFAEVLDDPRMTRATRWGPLGRADLVEFPRGGRRVILDAGVAAVRVPPPRPTAFRPSDVSLPYELRPEARVLVIGAGAGWEVAEALHFGAAHVDAVEINPAVAAFAPRWLKDDPRVGWHITDGRTFLHQGDDRYDAIVLIHTISNAATAAGAMRLAEDYLLTVEALSAMRARLAEGGLWLMTRPEAQIPALVGNLRAAGVQPQQLVSWAEAPTHGGFYAATLIHGAAEWTGVDLDRVRARLAERRLLPLHDPTRPKVGGGPTAVALRWMLGSANVDGDAQSFPPAWTRPRVATDDRPYFHQHRRWWSWSFGDLVGHQERSRLALEDAPLAEASVIVLLVETTVMAAVVLLLPLLVDRHRRRLDTMRVAAYFGGLGLAFMVVEVALVQRLGLLLGSPTLSFAVVFSGFLAGTAAGSRLSTHWPWPRHAAGLAAGMVGLLALVLPFLVDATLTAPLLGRVAVAFVTVATTGLALGMPFPLGLRAVGRRQGVAAWALAFNGVASVAGTSCAILIGAQLGLTMAVAAAAVVYAIVWGVGLDLDS